jgi:hypothetical protein
MDILIARATLVVVVHVLIALCLAACSTRITCMRYSLDALISFAASILSLFKLSFTQNVFYTLVVLLQSLSGLFLVSCRMFTKFVSYNTGRSSLSFLVKRDSFCLVRA